MANGTLLCSRCGTPNPQGQPACIACGLALTPAAAPGPQGNLGKQTMLGVGALPQPGAGQGRPAGSLGQTMLGGTGSPFAAGQSPQQAAPPPATPAPEGAFKGTMIGGVAGPQYATQPNAAPAPAPQYAAPAPAPQYAAPAPQYAAPAPQPAPAAPAAFRGTMLGGVAPAMPAAPQTQGPAFKGTMIGGMAPAMPAAAPQAQEPAFKGTMIGGMAPAMPAPAQPAHDPAFKGTMIGGVAGTAGAAQPGPAMAGPEAAGAGAGFKGTMLGMAPPGAAPSPLASAQASNATLPAAGHAPSPAPQPHMAQGHAPAALPGDKRTVLGVAVPGIAPLNPGVAKAAPQPMAMGSPPPAYAPAPYAMPGARASHGEIAPASKRGNRHVSPVMLILILLISGLVAFGGIAAYLVLKGASLLARTTVDASGNLQLELTCNGCADATSVQLDAKTASFRGQHATLPLAHPLKIGANELTVALTAPGAHRAETITLNVPVQFRVYGDLTALSESPPKLRVRVEAVSGTQVVMDGKPLALDAHGTAAYDVDISPRLIGSSPNTEQLEQKIAYTLTPPGEKPRNDFASFQMPIVPLMVDTPGASIVIENANFMLTGWTQKGSTVTVAGRAIPLDDQGRFEQLMSVSAVGETTIDVRASAPGRAPRLAPIHVKRVAHLLGEAPAYRTGAESNYAAIATDPGAKKEARVALDGTATDVRTDNHVTVLLLDVHEGCAAAPCLVRVLYGAKSDVRNGDPASAFGKLVGAVDGPRTGSKIPNVMAEFVLRGQK